MRLLKPCAPTGTALIPIDDVVDSLPFIVRRDHRIVAAFAWKMAAEDWALMRSGSAVSSQRFCPERLAPSSGGFLLVSGGNDEQAAAFLHCAKGLALMVAIRLCSGDSALRLLSRG
jgi:hypothetical protein